MSDRDSVMRGVTYHVDKQMSAEREYLKSLKNTVRLLEEVAIRRGNGKSVSPAEFEQVENFRGKKSLRPDGFIKTMPAIEKEFYTDYLSGFRPWATGLEEEIRVANTRAEKVHMAYPEVKRVWSALPEEFIICRKLAEIAGEMENLLKSPAEMTDEEFYGRYKQLYLSDKEEYRWLVNCMRHKAMVLEDICIIRGEGKEVSLKEGSEAVFEESMNPDFTLFRM